MAGTLEILNVGAGEMKITFDTQDAPEAIRAKRVITDMLRRGYVLLVQDAEGRHVRVDAFDEVQGTYLIADLATDEERDAEIDAPPQPRRGRGRYVRKPMQEAEAKAIAPSAGG